jgi:hypothetical protein
MTGSTVDGSLRPAPRREHCAAREPRRDRVWRCMRSTGVRVDEIVDDFAIAQFRRAIVDLDRSP